MIAHFDMDCFYAAIELRDKPYLEGKPVAVGGRNQRGVITTCNYEARKYGVRSAMSASEAKKRCPDLICLPLRFDLYREESRKIKTLIQELHPMLMMSSVDEGYVELSQDPQRALLEAQILKRKIKNETGLVVSIGIAPNKMLAKIASDLKKPNALNLVEAHTAEEFMRSLPVGKIPGVGPKAQEALKKSDILLCEDLQKLSDSEAFEVLGEWGLELRRKAFGGNLEGGQGLFSSAQAMEVRRKSVSLERTLEKQMMTYDEITRSLPNYYGQLKSRLRQHREKFAASKVKLNGDSRGELIAKAFVKIKFDDFSQTTCEKTLPIPSGELVDIEFFANLFFEAVARSTRGIRLLGLGVRFQENEVAPARRTLSRDPRQLPLFCTKTSGHSSYCKAS